MSFRGLCTSHMFPRKGTEKIQIKAAHCKTENGRYSQGLTNIKKLYSERQKLSFLTRQLDVKI